MENIILTKKVETPMLDAFNALDKNLVVTIFVCILVLVIILGVVINVLKLFADMRLSKNLYQAKIAQAESQKMASLISSLAEVKVAKEKEKDYPQTSLLNLLMRNMKLDANQVAECMNHIKSETNKSSNKATEEFLNDVIKNINNDIDNVTVEDLQKLIASEED